MGCNTREENAEELAREDNQRLMLVEAVKSATGGYVYVLEAEHFRVPGRFLSVHSNRASADAKAAEFVNMIAREWTENQELGDGYFPVATPETLEVGYRQSGG